MVVAHYRDRPKYDFGDVVTRLDLMSGGLKRVEEKLDEFMELGVSVPDEPVVEGRYDAGARMLGEAGGSKAFGPASVAGVNVGSSILLRYRCEHCGRDPSVARVGDICPACKEDGHWGDTRACSKCGNYGTGAL